MSFDLEQEIESARLRLIALQDERVGRPGQRHADDERISTEIAAVAYRVGKLKKLLRDQIERQRIAIEKSRTQASLVFEIAKGLSIEYEISVNGDIPPPDQATDFVAEFVEEIRKPQS